jgi:hypothetical protein
VPFENCWFARQPETEEEVLRAINALHVSCVEAIRYGGKDPGILTELIRRGHRSCCDELAKHGGS